MLQLQRASAGSGKTYLLAKKFIEYFISKREEGGPRRLRSARELRDSLKHILAITFTNKATNEMKLRIVDKLNSLANWTPGTPLKDVDYLESFCKDFNCSPEEIATLCKAALNTLLTEYGDFKVSTIDSFFQSVLRTFAYEADLDDTYGIELESDYVTKMGLDITLDEIDSDGKPTQGMKWIENMMGDISDSKKNWNIFQKKEGNHTIYGEIMRASKNLGKEDFKNIRDRLDEFFADVPDFFDYYRRLKTIYEKDIRAAHAGMRAAARKVSAAFMRIGLDMDMYAGQYLASRVRNMADGWRWYPASSDNISFKIPEFTRKGTQTRVFDPKKKDNPYLGTPEEDEIERLAKEMYAAFIEWKDLAQSEALTRWRLYDATLPSLGVLQSVRENARLFLTDSNTVELSETNSILRRIIGDDDASFIYERIGNRLEHFLIDEFQDTSALQWQNLRPLVSESEGKGLDNLIIGDAKQSIYRFRNADPPRITRVVPEEFEATCNVCGNSPQENTTWRGARHIVEFNNLFFRFFTHEISPEMQQLYSNTVQPPHHREDAGYVRLQLFESKDKDDDEVPLHFAAIPDLISDMLDRGYRMKDIAVLVDNRTHGSLIIESIMNHNRRTDIRHKIDFISADSLKIGESTAVQTVIAVLESINKGTGARLREGEERIKKGVGDWSRLKADFGFFAMKNADIPLAEQLHRFLSGEFHPDSIRDMLAEMSTTVLPALIEKIIRHFIPPRLRRADAPFLAALEDSVLDFCDTHTSDIASFLQWWEKRGAAMSISSPEDTDAVQVMTVHKSKGLEFRCVIVPYSKQTLTPRPHEKEWLWVKPALGEAEGLKPLPYLPVWTDKKLDETPHREQYQEYLRLYMADMVNTAYVAYKRAVDELYMCSPVKVEDGQPKGGSGIIGEYLWRCGSEAADIIDGIAEEYPDAAPYLPKKEDFSADPDSLTWEMGTLPTREEVLASIAQHGDDEHDSSIAIDEFRCGVEIPALLYQDPASSEADILPLEEETTPDEEEESDASAETEESRARGELLHHLMEHIITADDLPRAILKFKMRGHVSRAIAPRLEADILEALRSVESYGWFAPGVRVLRERAIATGGHIIRPDRVILHPDGSATVVDYKFGTHRNDSAYSRQVKRYADAIVAAGKAKKCEAYIWYVSLGEVLRCR